MQAGMHKIAVNVIVHFKLAHQLCFYVCLYWSSYNRSRPKNKRSFQAKKHLGLGLFCCKKPPKAEDNSGILTKKNIIRSLNAAPLDPNFTLYRSYGDKAYLCPGTGTGMMSARSQKVYPLTLHLQESYPNMTFPKAWSIVHLGRSCI
jgi:hypothetical protein